jgi:glycosyltransferase involved in cell wall biosynthesis
MPAHQAAATIEEAVGSVLAQTYEDFEVLVIENGSTDDTLARIERMAARDPRIYVFHLDEGCPVIGRNLGIENARGEFIAFLDADDIYLPGHLAFVDRAIREYPDRTLYAVGAVRVAPNGRRSRMSTTMPRTRPKELVLADVVKITLVPNMVAFPTSDLRELGGFHDCRVEDYDLWVRTFAAGRRGIYLPAALSEHRIIRTSRSHHPDAYEASVDSAVASLRKALAHEISVRDRRSIERHIALLVKRRERIRARTELEARLRAREYGGARAAYLHAAPAYRSRPRFIGGLALMLVSPRLFRRVLVYREGEPDGA